MVKKWLPSDNPADPFTSHDLTSTCRSSSGCRIIGVTMATLQWAEAGSGGVWRLFGGRAGGLKQGERRVRGHVHRMDMFVQMDTSLWFSRSQCETNSSTCWWCRSCCCHNQLIWNKDSFLSTVATCLTFPDLLSNGDPSVW